MFYLFSRLVSVGDDAHGVPQPACGRKRCFFQSLWFVSVGVDAHGDPPPRFAPSRKKALQRVLPLQSFFCIR